AGERRYPHARDIRAREETRLDIHQSTAFACSLDAKGAGDARRVEERIDRDAALAGQGFEPKTRKAWKLLRRRHGDIDCEPAGREAVLARLRWRAEIGRAEKCEPVRLSWC